MHGIRTSTRRLPLFLALAGSLFTAEAATPDYFPLQTGNSWAYRISQGRQTTAGTINVGSTVSANGQTYYQLQFFDRSVMLRQDASGSLLAYDSESKQES